MQTGEAFMEAMRDKAHQQMELWNALLQEQRRLRAAEALLQEHDDLIWQAFGQLEGLPDQNQLTAQFSNMTRLLPSLADAINPAQKAAIKDLVDDVVAPAQEKGI